MNQEILKKYSQAEFQTSLGNFTIEFFNDKMPITVANFLNLADSGYFDGIKFHRVIKDFMIQGGDPLTKDDNQMSLWGTGGPGYAIPDEHVADPELSNIVGTISMANSGPNSGGSQFFINVADNSFLDFDKEPLTSKHPVFGKVIGGMDVVNKISQVKTLMPGRLDRPEIPVVIEKINLK
ncbi:MAG: peptidylprolyl isomerase [Patescibacteria group bacterium]|nr:peptidylprolyl isomerase [Patescibacteria group bacterium]